MSRPKSLTILAAILLISGCSQDAPSDAEVEAQIKSAGITLARPFSSVKQTLQNSCESSDASLELQTAMHIDNRERDSIKLLRIALKAYCPDRLALVDKVLVDAGYQN